MGARLRAKNKKIKRNLKRAQDEKKLPRRHKGSRTLSESTMQRKINRA